MRTRPLLVRKVAAAYGVNSSDGPLDKDHGTEEDRKVQPTRSTPLHPVSFVVLFATTATPRTVGLTRPIDTD